MIYVFYRLKESFFHVRQPRFYYCDYEPCKYAFNDSVSIETIYSFLSLNLRPLKVGDILSYDNKYRMFFRCFFPLDFHKIVDADSSWDFVVQSLERTKDYLFIDPQNYSPIDLNKNDIYSSKTKRQIRGAEWVKKLEIKD